MARPDAAVHESSDLLSFLHGAALSSLKYGTGEIAAKSRARLSSSIAVFPVCGSGALESSSCTKRETGEHLSSWSALLTSRVEGDSLDLDWGSRSSISRVFKRCSTST